MSTSKNSKNIGMPTKPDNRDSKPVWQWNGAGSRWVSQLEDQDQDQGLIEIDRYMFYDEIG